AVVLGWRHGRIRAGLAMVPGLALRHPIKKWAALAAMVAGSFYTVFAGGDVATVRSLVMTLVLLGAILVDRPALSMRNLAVAALVVLSLEPETLLAPGFQMSFAAVAGLVAAFEAGGRPAAEIDLPGVPPAGGRPAPAPTGLLARIGRGAAGHVFGTLLSTLVAEAATAPFGLFHFQRFTPYGLVGNALTLPLVSLVVMPAALLGAVALPFGLDAPVWSVMGWGVAAMLDVAAVVAAWPGATRAVPAFGVAALGLLTVGLLWLTLWRTPLRLGGIALMGAGVALAAAAVPPDLVVAADGRSLVVRGAGGRLVTLGRQSGDFALDQWLRADGDTRSAASARQDGGAACDPFGCVVRLPDGRAIAHVTDAQAFEEDCGRAALVVTPLRAPSWCAAETIDAAFLARSGATALTARAGGFDRMPDRRPLRDRPWARAITSPPEAAGGVPSATARSEAPARAAPQ
ncbi:MAG: ComEC/Rec2 family competence protein, partial [Alsobacter sp.]